MSIYDGISCTHCGLIFATGRGDEKSASAEDFEMAASHHRRVHPTCSTRDHLEDVAGVLEKSARPRDSMLSLPPLQPPSRGSERLN